MIIKSFKYREYHSEWMWFTSGLLYFWEVYISIAEKCTAMCVWDWLYVCVYVYFWLVGPANWKPIFLTLL